MVFAINAGPLMRPAAERTGRGGFTFVEILIALVFLAGFVLGLYEVQRQISEAITAGQDATIAANLAEEKIESLKSLPFYHLIVTSTTALDSRFDPIMIYDSAYHIPEDISFGATVFTRRTLVEKVDAPYGTVANMGYPHPDTGLKRITVCVVWTNRRRILKKFQVSTLKANPDREPLNKTVAGTVTNALTGLAIAGANVAARRNPGWASVTSSSGVYSFQATDSTMRLVANKRGYYGYDNGSFFTLYATGTVFNFQMMPISSRTVAGYAQYHPGLVISQVCPNDNSREYIEIYNPTTSTVAMADKKLKYMDQNGAVTDVPLVFLTNSIPARGYFLILGSPNGTDVTAPANGKAADATYNNHAPDIQHTQDGGVALATSYHVAIDSMGWGDAAPTGSYWGSYYYVDTPPGTGPQACFIRKAVSSSTVSDMGPPWGAHVALGNAWNSWNNSQDFVLSSVIYPRNSSDSTLPQGGTVLPDAFVSADDSVSSTVQASATGYFEITMATGAWTIYAASGTLQGSRAVTLAAGAGKVYTNVAATTTSNTGFVTGEIRKFSDPNDLLAGLLVQADPGGYQTVSNSQGEYFFAIPEGQFYITGNPDFNDPDWNTATTTGAVVVTAGVMTDGVHLNIWMDGWISGQVRVGADGVPGAVVVATGNYANGNSAVTDSGGFYTIKGLRLVGNPYGVTVALDSGQSAAPPAYTLSVTQGGNVTGTDFTLNWINRSLSGAVTDGGRAITTGVLVMASTAAISAASPPDINFALRSGPIYYYQTLSDMTGRFTLEVPGGLSYNVVAWYAKEGAVSAKNYGFVLVDASTGTSGVNFQWP